MASHRDYDIGILKMDVEGKDSERFARIVSAAVDQFRAFLTRDKRLKVSVESLDGPHLMPGSGAYSPLEFLELVFAEKTERGLPFMIAVTEVDLSGANRAYTLALPSPITNVAIVSTRRLDPSFWGKDADEDVAAQRLATLLRYAFGKLVNLRDTDDTENLMHPLTDVSNLNVNASLTEAQWEAMRRQLPREAHDKRTRSGFAQFFFTNIFQNVPEIWKAVTSANPFRLATKLPTMIAAALSVIVVMLFGAETWDVANAMTIGQTAIFSVVSLGSALFLLYRSFAIDTVLSRQGSLTESMVVTTVSTIVTLLLTILLLFAGFALVMYVGIITVFPTALMANWPTTGDANSTLDHAKLAAFLAAMGILAGSLGGRSDSKKIVRGVLFNAR